MATIAEKYQNLVGKSIKDMTLEIVEKIASEWKGDGALEITCGWWDSEYKPKADGRVFDFMAGECYHTEINNVMKEQGFSIYEEYGGYRHRARTYYRLEAKKEIDYGRD